MKKIYVMFLYVAVPVVTRFKFRCLVTGCDVTIIGRRAGLPIVWIWQDVKKNWYSVKRLQQQEQSTEYLFYKDRLS